MDKNNISNYNIYLKKIYKFKHLLLNNKSKQYKILDLFNENSLKKFKLSDDIFKFKSNKKPYIEYTNNFNISVLFESNNNNLVVELNLPYLELYNKDLKKDFYYDNTFLKLINLKNISVDNPLFNELKNQYIINLNKYNIDTNTNNDLYDTLFDLKINNLLNETNYNNLINNYYSNDDKNINLLNMITILNLKKNNFFLNSNKKGNFYKNKYYISNDNSYKYINKDYELKNKNFNNINKNNITLPIHNNIIDINNKLKNNYIIDNTKYYDNEYENYISFKILNNNDYKQYINDNIINKNYILNIKQKQITTPKKENNIYINLKKNNFTNNYLIITNNNIHLTEGNYLNENTNNKSYDLKGFKWRNYLHNSNMDYSFVYDNLLWSSVNHCILYKLNNDDRYSLDYDNIYYKQKDKYNYIGYGYNIVEYNGDFNYKDILLEKILQNKDLYDILINTKDSILINDNNIELSFLMEIRKDLKNYKLSDKKIKYLEYNSIINKLSDIIINNVYTFKDESRPNKDMIKARVHIYT